MTALETTSAKFETDMGHPEMNQKWLYTKLLGDELMYKLAGASGAVTEDGTDQVCEWRANQLFRHFSIF